MMTPQEQRFALAEFCGRKREDLEAWLDWELALTQFQNAEIDEPELYRRRRKCLGKAPLDYLNDLNAIHEAEEKVPRLYWRELAKLTGVSLHSIGHATAAQRAEALCRTLWPERWT